VINQLKNKSTETTNTKKYAEAYTIFTLFWDQLRYFDPSGSVGNYDKIPQNLNDFQTRFKEKVKVGNEPIYSDYQNYFKIFESAFNTFFS
jgi:hypothetical protein